MTYFIVVAALIAALMLYGRRFSWKARFRASTKDFRYLDWPDRPNGNPSFMDR